MDDSLSAASEAAAAEPKQEALKFARREETAALETPLAQEMANSVARMASPTEELLQTAREILCRELVEPQSESNVAELLGIPKSQVKVLLKQLVAEGILEKFTRPIRYTVAKREDRLL